MASDDLVVVLPGIMGSTLSHHGKPVWAPSAGAALRAVFTLGRSLRDLTLPDGVGDDHPGDGVEPVALMPDLHLLPGIWTPVTGYDVLVRRLQKIRERGEIGQVLPVPYDWRLSNRYNATRLATIVDPALERWRASAPERAEGRLVFVCHSMGGLVARWYVEKCGGAGHTRMVVTMGTPYRGAARAVEQLVNGVRHGLGPIGLDLTVFARSLPSLYQLLPDYACVDRAGELLRLDETDVPVLDTSRIADAVDFHTQLAAAEASRPGSADSAHAIVGVRQPTVTSVTVAGEGVAGLPTIGGDNDYGDGTVPLSGAIGYGRAMDTNAVRRVVERHGNLQAHAGALDELESVLVARPVRRRAGERVSVRVEAPELVLTGEPLVVQVVVEGDMPPGVRITLVAEQAPGGARSVVAARSPRLRDGHARSEFTDVAPGGYLVEVSGVRAGSPISTVTAPVLVWGPDVDR